MRLWSYLWIGCKRFRSNSAVLCWRVVYVPANEIITHLVGGTLVPSGRCALPRNPSTARVAFKCNACGVLGYVPQLIML